MKVKNIFTDNLSYKMVSLFIALILWFTILGRRDFTLSKTMEVEAVATSGLLVDRQSVDTIKVKVSGPRTALKKFLESGLTPLVTVDVTKRGAGDHLIEIPESRIDVPFGVKIVSVSPNKFRVRVVKRE